jgi:hypothetical protein
MFGTTSNFLTEQQFQHFTSATASALSRVCYLVKHTDLQLNSTSSTQHTNTEGFSTTKRNQVQRRTQLPWEMRSSRALHSEWPYHYSLRNPPEERTSHLLRGWRLKPPNTTSLLSCSNLPQHYHAKGLRYSKRPGIALLFKHCRITYWSLNLIKIILVNWLTTANETAGLHNTDRPVNIVNRNNHCLMWA